MGTNTTRQKRRGEFMKMGLADLAGWHLMVRCTACTDDRYLPIDVLLARYGPQHTLGRIVPRLRCRFPTCRREAGGVRLYASLDTGAVCVVLVGPGAF
jgi:hypothetical protein